MQKQNDKQTIRYAKNPYQLKEGNSQYALTEIPNQKTKHIVASYLKPHQNMTEIKNLLDLIQTHQTDQQIVQEIGFTLKLLQNPRQQSCCDKCDHYYDQAFDNTAKLTRKLVENIWCFNCMHDSQPWTKEYCEICKPKCLLISPIILLTQLILSPLLVSLTIVAALMVPFIWICYCIKLSSSKKYEQKADTVVSVLQQLQQRIKYKIQT